ncbi:hypothetical protein D3C80_1049440 [compost metagenome]
MRHEDKLGTQQADAFGTQVDYVGDAGAFTDIGAHLHRVAITGHGRFQPPRRCGLQALGTLVAFGQGRAQYLIGRRNGQPPALAVEQQRATRRQQQHRRTGADHRRDAQGTRDDGTVGGRATARRENAGHAGRVQARNVRGPHFIHYQNVRFLRLLGGGNAAQLGQDPTADIAQVRRTLGQQGIVQRFLLPRGRFDHRHPGRRRAFALLEAVIDLIAQFRVVEHFQMRNEDLADGLGLAALDQAVDIVAHIGHRLLQTLTLGCRRLAP